MEHNAIDIETYISQLSSLLKVFSMFQMHLLYHENNEEDHVLGFIAIQCSSCNRNTGFYSKE